MMVTNEARTQASTPSLLAAEVQNEPQWIVWPDAEHEATWAEEELARELLPAEVLAALGR